MRRNNYKIITVLLFLFFILTNCSDDKSSTEPELNLSVDQALVGTWDLTKITTNVGGTPLTLTPEQAGIASTATFNADGTFESVNTDSEGTTTDIGTWGVSDGKLYLMIEGEETDSSVYSINGNVATIESTVPVEGFGEVPATLEFTKRS